MITMQNVSKLRISSGYPIGQCKQALIQCNNDLQKALEYLKNLKVDKKYSTPIPITQNSTVAGLIHSYVHHNGKIGVLLEVHCDTDFTTKTDEFKQLCDNICMQIAATNPTSISPDEFRKKNNEWVEAQKLIAKNKLHSQNKPQNMIQKIIEGMIDKQIRDQCLVTQPFIMNEKTNISDLIDNLQKITKEHIKITRFKRFELGK